MWCTNIVLKRFSPFQSISRALDIWSRQISSSSKIDQFYTMIAIKQNIFRFEISMNNIIFLMDCLYCLEQMRDIVLVYGFTVDSEMFGVLPKLPFFRALHLQV